MNQPRYSVHIDRLVLTDLDVTPGEAERIRNQVAGELQRLLGRSEGLAALAGGDVGRLNAPAVRAAELDGNSRLVYGLARSLAAALRATGRGEGVD